MPEVVTGMYLSMLLLPIILICVLRFMISLGVLLVNSFLSLVLFYSGASWSFVSLSFSRSFEVSLGVLDCCEFPLLMNTKFLL